MQSTDEEISVPEMGLALVLRMRGGIEDGGDEDGGDGEVRPAIDVGAARHTTTPDPLHAVLSPYAAHACVSFSLIQLSRRRICFIA